MKNTTIDYADFAEYDRRQSAIQRHVVLAFLAGLAVGALGMAISGLASDLVGEFYDPYAYLALAIVVGATATGFGWALLTTFLAGTSMLVSAMGGSAVLGQSDFEVIGGGHAAGLNLLLVLLVAVGLLAHVTRRSDRWGDLAAGAITGLLLGDVIDRATPGFIDSQPGFWPVPAVMIGTLSVALIFVMRGTAAGRARAAVLATGVAAVIAALALAF